MTETQKAYLAGLVDGEGCIFIKHTPASQMGPKARNDSFSLWLKVGLCHRKTVYAIRRMVGMGSIPNPPKVDLKKRSQPWAWIVNGRQAGKVLSEIRPYLITKAKEADVGLEFDRLPFPPRGGATGSKIQPVKLIRSKHRLHVKLRKLKPRFKFYKDRFPLSKLHPARDWRP